jgi:glycosyltransferase involved in cell wall biosynthesis
VTAATEKQTRPVLFVGNFLSGHDGRRTYSEDLAARLEAAGVPLLRASRRMWKPARLADMVGTALGARGAYGTAVVDVYSGQAFLWAEAAARAARTRRRRLVLALHGGGLPEFAARHGARVARLLEMADAVVAPSGYLREAMARCREDIEVIPNAIDLERYPFRLRARVAPRLVWLRSYHEIYNPVMAVEVLARVRERHPEARLMMYGADKDGSLARCREAARRLGGLAGASEDQEKIGRLASECFDLLARGGEGHLVVGRALEAVEEKSCHMFISLKPFGCMPATQADGVLALVAAKHPELVILPLETLGEAEANALNRVDMALADARRRAREEFSQTLRQTGRTLEEIRRFVSARPEMQSPFYRFRRKSPPASTAAQFVLHVAERMRRERC